MTIIAQKPKVAPYIEQMENNVAHALGLEKNQINIKATTKRDWDLQEVFREYPPMQSVCWRTDRCGQIGKKEKQDEAV